MTRFAFVDAQKAHHHVRTICRLLRVSHSGYYAWAGGRPPSARAVADGVLLEQIRTIHSSSRASYGAPRVHAELADLGVRVGVKRVARLMREDGLVGVSRRRWRVGTTQRRLRRCLGRRTWSTGSSSPTAPTSCGSPT